ncbi:MAG: thymidylate synthase [Methylobacter sp.]|uniref:thymidylate synthase n=1 Tax=Methylobacter sp. TaxID=2051955 RepID=UPI0025E1C98B|nr:thymidylate synthase [Methylobacter sp.]MCK9622598.1 thymidylate synthase [Methylobacter sp.]
MKQYLDLLNKVLTEGEIRTDRTGTGTIGLFGDANMAFDLSEGFPLITTKKLHFPSIAHELIFFLSGKTNIQYLKDNKVTIWDEFADENGEIGRMYGTQWREWRERPIKVNLVAEEGKIPNVELSFNYIDQIAELIKGLKENPFSRRHILSAWNVGELHLMKLPPCHAFVQFYVSNDRKLSCKLTQRSGDSFLGIPYNIASYALLTHLLAQQTDLEVGKLYWSGGDTHIYLNHIEQVKEQLSREPKTLPTITIEKQPSIDDYKFEHFKLNNYNAWPHIKGEVSV